MVHLKFVNLGSVVCPEGCQEDAESQVGLRFSHGEVTDDWGGVSPPPPGGLILFPPQRKGCRGRGPALGRATGPGARVPVIPNPRSPPLIPSVEVSTEGPPWQLDGSQATGSKPTLESIWFETKNLQ